MPTGYTAKVQDGTMTEFRDYALSCARAFGALVEMRDDAPDAPIPDEFKADDWHDKQLADAKARLARLRALPPGRAAEEARVAHREAVAQWRERESRRTDQQARYEAMLAKVEAYTAPTPDHEGLEKFMADQLRQSIEFDCGKPAPKPAAQTVAEWQAAQIKSAEWDVEYHTREAAGAKQRAAQRAAWVRALKDSLAEPALV